MNFQSVGQFVENDRPPSLECALIYADAVARATSEGVPVRGYFHWSLMDDFEWADNFGSLFGPIYVDYATQQRCQASASFYREVAARNRLVGQRA